MNKNRGFVILYAVLITTILATVGAIIANIVAKQLIMAYIEKSGQVAYYAAYAGFECAVKNNIDDDGNPHQLFLPDPSARQRLCFGRIINLVPSSNPNVRCFKVNLTIEGCAKVYVEKTASGPLYHVYGYNKNSACSAGGSTDLRMVEKIVHDGGSIDLSYLSACSL